MTRVLYVRIYVILCSGLSNREKYFRKRVAAYSDPGKHNKHFEVHTLCFFDIRILFFRPRLNILIFLPILG